MAADYGWKDRAVGDVLVLEYGWGLPAESRSGTGLPVFGSSGEVGRHFASRVPGPGIVVGRKGTVGSVIWSQESFWPIDTAYYVVPTSEVDLRWLYWRLGSLGLGTLDSSTGVPGLNRHDAYEKRLRLPPLPEQRRIAAILDTLDEAIRRTEQVIEKLKAVKQGLLHDLLTRGIDDNGDLRPPPEEAPHLYKDSVLGRIPRGWEVRPMPRMFVKVSPGPRQDQRSCVPDGRTPVLDQSEDGYIGYCDANPGVPATAEWPAVTFANHTCAVRWITFPCSAIQNVFFMRGASGVETRFLYHSVRGRVPQQAYQGHWPLLQETVSAVPPLAEQERIVGLLDLCEERQRAEERGAEKLRTLKTGLMDDLLTGRVRASQEAS